MLTGLQSRLRRFRPKRKTTLGQEVRETRADEAVKNPEERQQAVLNGKVPEGIESMAYKGHEEATAPVKAGADQNSRHLGPDQNSRHLGPDQNSRQYRAVNNAFERKEPVSVAQGTRVTRLGLLGFFMVTYVWAENPGAVDDPKVRRTRTPDSTERSIMLSSGRCRSPWCLAKKMVELGITKTEKTASNN
ncbi:hypothetical protein PG984_006521 [Apiospora sp. TS-2023a]